MDNDQNNNTPAPAAPEQEGADATPATEAPATGDQQEQGTEGGNDEQQKSA